MKMKPEKIVIHHSLTKDSGSVSWGAIRRYHEMKKNWIDIGYHFGIEKVNGTYEILMGRMMNQAGAHCRAKGFNQFSLGICLVGNLDEKMTTGIWLGAFRLVHSLMDVFGLKPEDVVGHREVADDGRTCPGMLFDLDDFREKLES